MKDGHSIPVSRNRRSQVQDAYMRFLHRAGERAPAFEADGRMRQEGPWRILLVDDDPADRMIWGDILKRHGCVVLQAGNGEKAVLRLLTSSGQMDHADQFGMDDESYRQRKIHYVIYDPGISFPENAEHLKIAYE